MSVIPAKAGIQKRSTLSILIWMPAGAGMTVKETLWARGSNPAHAVDLQSQKKMKSSALRSFMLTFNSSIV